jgi:hypothetical protein
MDVIDEFNAKLDKMQAQMEEIQQDMRQQVANLQTAITETVTTEVNGFEQSITDAGQLIEKNMIASAELQYKSLISSISNNAVSLAVLMLVIYLIARDMRKTNQIAKSPQKTASTGIKAVTPSNSELVHTNSMIFTRKANIGSNQNVSLTMDEEPKQGATSALETDVETGEAQKSFSYF